MSIHELNINGSTKIRVTPFIISEPHKYIPSMDIRSMDLPFTLKKKKPIVNNFYEINYN